MKRVVITGLGCITPIGNDVTSFWNNVKLDVSGTGKITKFDASKHKTQIACEVKNFNIENYIDKKSSKKIDLCSIYALGATEEAICDAKIDFSNINKQRCGVIYASGIGGLNSLENQLEEYYSKNDPTKFSPFYITRMISNMPAGMITIKYDLQGLSFTPVSACTSSNHALICALNFIRAGQADLIIAGGTEASITASAVAGFNAMKALSTCNNNPNIASRPYDVNRDGFVIGEGAGTLILEEYEHAIKRGAHIYAELIGGGMSSDAYHITAPDPNGKGAFQAMQNALEDGNISPSEIDYINTHGTSTPAGDIPELEAIKNVFGEYYSNIFISSTKSMTGHLLGATSAVEAIACVMSIKDSIIPATINTETVDPNIPIDTRLVLGKSIQHKVGAVLSNSFGFGGHNATVVFKSI